MRREPTTRRNGSRRAESAAMRIADTTSSCRIGGDEDRRHDIVVPPSPLQHVLETLAKTMKRDATVDAAIMQDSREYGYELRNVTTAEALKVLCLVAHVAVRDEGSVLVFTTNSAP